MKRKIDLGLKLTENFTLREFVESPTAMRLGIDNTPPVETCFGNDQPLP